MDAKPSPTRTREPKPALAAFAALGAAWVFVLVTLGAFTTSINAGMAFADWPLSNGSLNPPGWLTNLAQFSEHSHRLSAGLMSTITIVLAAWIWRSEGRAWLRKLAVFSVILVLFQAVLGGLRVLFDALQVPMVNTSLGRIFAMLHACLAQVFVCTLIAIAAACSRGWIERPRPVGPALRRAGVWCCALLLVQLAVAAVMRHSFAGLAIPSFPLSSASGALFPPVWSFPVAINFAHRSLALVLTFALIWFALRIWRDRGASPCMCSGASALVSLLVLQIFLGASIVWTLRDPMVTTAHVLVGSLTLSTAFWLTWLAHRDSIEAAS
jgi:cytochrome c oxidase assembly protein subunit 15